MKTDFFEGSSNTYHSSSHFFRIEFQQRGAPHVHSLLWLKNSGNEDAPSFWTEEEDQLQPSEIKQKNIEDFADMLISTSSDDMFCEKHETKKENPEEIKNCNDCNELKAKVDKYQNHYHTFTCDKKKRSMTINGNEGHGRLDGLINKEALTNITVCRFNFPKFPLDETKLVLGISKDTEESTIKARKQDLNKITKYLIRQTYTEKKLNESESWKKLKTFDFWEFLYESGMFSGTQMFCDYTETEKQEAKIRYLNAISK